MTEEDQLNIVEQENFQEAVEKVDMSWNGESSDLMDGLTFQSRRQVKKFVSLCATRDKCNMVVMSGGAGDSCKSKKVRKKKKQKSVCS